MSQPPQRMTDSEAQEAFQFRKVGAPERYRIYEKPGRYWLLSYVMPVVLLVGAYVLWPVDRSWVHQHLHLDKLGYGVAAVVVAACAASGCGLTSVVRSEAHADRAYQPMWLGFITLLFALKWWMMRP